MTEEERHPSIEEVFNANLDALLQERDIEHRDLLDLLEQAGYTPDTPATVLLNDAVAIAAVLGVSPLQLLIPEADSTDLTPAIAAEARSLSLWLRGLRPLREQDFASFHRQAGIDDIDAELVAEHWVWSERVRTAALTIALNDAVEAGDLEAVKQLTVIAASHVNQTALEQADRRVPRSVRNGELQAAITRATRFRRQKVSRRPTD
ncbi:MAG: hypothetical protein HKO63_12380 [Acidimicrobiia bacterium]|nr:hypothetical protein [Acidimicrobiia bacterium]RZV45275.1 MAG: hypothetical protein EX267_05715 [Acidimicrobiia bacterium]